MRIRSTATVLGAMLLAVLAFSVPSSAQEGYPAPPTTAAPGAVSAGTVTAGGSVGFSGGGFAGGVPVQLSVNGAAAGQITTSSSGAFNAELELDECGDNVLSASGEGPDGELRTVTSTVTVVCAATGGGTDDTDDGAGAGAGDTVAGGSLPFTGSGVVLTALVAGLALVAVGALFVFGARSRARRLA